MHKKYSLHYIHACNHAMVNMVKSPTQNAIKLQAGGKKLIYIKKNFVEAYAILRQAGNKAIHLYMY